MTPEQLADLATLLATTGGLVAGIVQVLKVTVLPAAWHHGRAPMILAAALAALAVAGALIQLGAPLARFDTWQAGLAAFLAVYGTAVGAHQTISKAGRVMTGTTDPTGPDDAP